MIPDFALIVRRTRIQHLTTSKTYRNSFADSVQMQNGSGDLETFIASRIEGDKLTVNAYHPLAGKTLDVTAKIISVRDVTEEDAMQVATGAQGRHTLN